MNLHSYTAAYPNSASPTTLAMTRIGGPTILAPDVEDGVAAALVAVVAATTDEAPEETVVPATDDELPEDAAVFAGRYVLGVKVVPM
jgi:hypothetical protein